MYEALVPKRAREAYRSSRYKERLDALALRLLDRGYAKRTIESHLRECLRFLADCEGRATSLPSDAGASEVGAYIDRRAALRHGGLGGVRRALALLLDEEAVDRLRASPPPSEPPPLYEICVPPYLCFVRRHRGRRTTHQLENTLDEFFRWLADHKIADLRGVEARDIRDFLGSFPGRHRTTIATYASALRGFLRYLRMQGVVDRDLVPAVEIPAGYRLSEPPDVWDEQTVEGLLAAVDRSIALGKRDYAMLLLAARCGLRPCDIRGLRFDDVRWRDQRIVFVQAKTRRELELPLPADVEHALVDYIRRGRPDCSAREIFVRHIAPICPFVKENNLWSVVARALRTAGLQPETSRRGMYVLRHSLATRMLKHGVAIDTIGDVLGHVSTDTTRKYAQVDLDGLRAVALSESEVRG